MERFMMFNDRPIDSFLVMQLSDLAQTLARDRRWTVEFAAHSGVHLAKQTIYVSQFWDVYPSSEKEQAMKSDVVLRMIGTRRHTDIAVVRTFRQTAEAQPLSKLLKQLFSFAEDLRLETICERERPGLKRWFRARRRLYRQYFAQQWQANRTRGAFTDQFLAAMYLRLTNNSPLDDVPLAPMADEAGQARLEALWPQFFDVSSTAETARWTLAIVELVGDVLSNDMVNNYTSLPIVDDDEDERKMTLQDLKRTDPLENRDTSNDSTNSEVHRQVLSTWHRETSRTGGNVLRFELERGTRTGMLSDGARPGEDGDQALAIVQGTSRPTNRNEYGPEAQASFDDHPPAGSSALYGEANRQAELVLLPSSPPSPIHLQQYRTKQTAVAPYRKRLVRVMEQWLEHQRSAWRTNLPAGRLRKQLIPFFTDERPRLFYKKGEPARRFDAVFGLLVDCSASMHDKIEETKTGLVLCHEALKTLRVPHAIVGFWEDANEATASRQPNYMQIAVSFRQSLEPSSGPAIMQLEPREDNRDGLAIRWMTEQLLRRSETQKVLLVFSDGEPAAYGYEQNGIIDTHEAVAEARRHGIEVVNLFLGRGADDESTRRTIENIYGRFRVFVPHVSELTDRLIPLLKTWLQKACNKKGWEAMIKLFTDSDLDGIGCGLLAKLAFTEVNISFCSYRNLDERVTQFLQSEEADNAMLFITDLAVGKDVEEQLAERAKRGGHVQVIDHHVTALHFNDYPWGWVVPADDDGKKTSATSLFYDYLVREGKLAPSDSLATFVELVRQYDTWEWEENGNLQAKRLNDLLTILGLDGFWDTMSERLASGEPFTLTETEELILDMEEKKIQRYIRQKQKQLVQRSLGDYCIGVVFAERHLSELGNALSKRYPHLDLIAMVNMGTKHIGFRTIHDDVNVAEFAKQFGGGGHPKASGCFVDDTTFPLFVVETFPLLPVYGDAEQNQLNQRDEAEGTFWTNHHGQWWLSRRTEQGWTLYADGGETRTFPEETIGERWLKRQFAAGLAHDATVLEFLSARLGRDKDTIQADYPAAVKQYKQQTGIER